MPEARVKVRWITDTRDFKAGKEYTFGLASAKQLEKEGKAKIIKSKSKTIKPLCEEADVIATPVALRIPKKELASASG